MKPSQIAEQVGSVGERLASWHRERPMMPARTLAGILTVLLVVGGMTFPAGAHGGDAQIAVVSVVPGSDSMHRDVTVKVTFGDDNHNVDDATVNVGGVSDTGDSLVPITLQPVGEGQFSGTVGFPSPGTWSTTVTVVEPPGQLTLDPVVIEQPTTESVPPDEPETTPIPEQLGDPDSGVDDSGQSANARAADDADTEESGGFPIALAVLAALVVLAGAAGWYVLNRRGEQEQSPREDEDDEDGGGSALSGGAGAP